MSHSVPSLTRVSVREIAKSCKSTKKFSPEHAVGQDFFIFHAFFSKNPVFVFHSFPLKLDTRSGVEYKGGNFLEIRFDCKTELFNEYLFDPHKLICQSLI